jgi:hypothetical protein
MAFCLKYVKVDVAMHFHRNVDCGTRVEPQNISKMQKKT